MYKNMLRLVSGLIFMIEVVRVLRMVHSLQPKVLRWHTCWTISKVWTLNKVTGTTWVSLMILLWWHTWWRKQNHLPKRCVFSSKGKAAHEAQYMCYPVQVLYRQLLIDWNQSRITCSACVQRATMNFDENTPNGSGDTAKKACWSPSKVP